MPIAVVMLAVAAVLSLLIPGQDAVAADAARTAAQPDRAGPVPAHGQVGDPRPLHRPERPVFGPSRP